MQLSDYSRIPPHMMESLVAYVEKHRPVGDFLQAVVANDLYGAVSRADDTNIQIIPIYVNWFYNEAPGNCWGYPQAHDEWTARGAK